jgi:hypothetical protein
MPKYRTTGILRDYFVNVGCYTRGLVTLSRVEARQLRYVVKALGFCFAVISATNFAGLCPNLMGLLVTVVLTKIAPGVIGLQ